MNSLGQTQPIPNDPHTLHLHHKLSFEGPGVHSIIIHQSGNIWVKGPHWPHDSDVCECHWICRQIRRSSNAKNLSLSAVWQCWGDELVSVGWWRGRKKKQQHLLGLVKLELGLGGETDDYSNNNIPGCALGLAPPTMVLFTSEQWGTVSMD